MCALATASKTVAMASVVWVWSSPSFPRSGVAGEAVEVVRPALFSDLFSPAGCGGEGRWRSVWELWFLVVLLLFFVGASPAGRGGGGRGLLELQGGWWLCLAGEAVPAVKRWPFVPGLLLRSAGAGSGAGGEVSGVCAGVALVRCGWISLRCGGSAGGGRPLVPGISSSSSSFIVCSSFFVSGSGTDVAVGTRPATSRPHPSR